ncbi:hypothetical protein GGI00_003482 [Coemansia sp. RSA 2681]|nr:hypothetical protein GGI00_003482 [Coemansia sp. RSA 2681]
MNIDALECQRVGLGTYNESINAVAYRRIRAYRGSGVRWKDIHRHFLQYPKWTLLRSRYIWFHAKQEGKPGLRLTTKWTDDERHRAKEIVSQHPESTTKSELVDVVQCEFPDNPLGDIRLVVYYVLRRLKTRLMTKSQMNRLRELVAEHGEDWDCIGNALGVLPSRARHNWHKYSGDISAWSLDDTLRLQRLNEAGVKPKEAAKLLGAKSHWACLAKTFSIRQSGKQPEMRWQRCAALQKHSHSKPAAVPISADELREISRLVDKYAGKYSVVEIIAKICAQLSLASKTNYHGRIALLIAAHPHYKAKLRDIDYTDLANRIALGQTTVRLAAKELDVPWASLVKNMQLMHNKLYVSQWVDEETRKLIDYVQGCNAKHGLGYFIKLLGIKSSM